MNVDIETANKLVSPTVGLPAVTNELTAFNMRKWLDKNIRREAAREAPALTKEDNWVPPTPEQVSRAQEAVRAFKARCVIDTQGKSNLNKAVQKHDPDALLEALKR